MIDPCTPLRADASQPPLRATWRPNCIYRLGLSKWGGSMLRKLSQGQSKAVIADTRPQVAGRTGCDGSGSCGAPPAAPWSPKHLESGQCVLAPGSDVKGIVDDVFRPEGSDGNLAPRQPWTNASASMGEQRITQSCASLAQARSRSPDRYAGRLSDLAAPKAPHVRQHHSHTQVEREAA